MTDLEISQRIGRAVAEGLEEDSSVGHMTMRLLTMAAGFAAGLGDDPAMCEEHFVEAARRVYRYARQPPVVVCTKCHQKNRLKQGPSSVGNPVCATCKTPILPGIMAFLEQDDDASAVDTTGPANN